MATLLTDDYGNRRMEQETTMRVDVANISYARKITVHFFYFIFFSLSLSFRLLLPSESCTFIFFGILFQFLHRRGHSSTQYKNVVSFVVAVVVIVHIQRICSIQNYCVQKHHYFLSLYFLLLPFLSSFFSISFVRLFFSLRSLFFFSSLFCSSCPKPFRSEFAVFFSFLFRFLTSFFRFSLLFSSERTSLFCQ